MTALYELKLKPDEGFMLAQIDGRLSIADLISLSTSDRVRTLEITLVYCTLCGTVIPYDSRVGGVTRTFGTSGLLYLSNKLMFDAETNSLWSSLEGAPVVGPLVGRGLHLTILPVVTTTWGEWRRAHPETTALSLDTGYSRDYSEGAAYREYFATDRLMFEVSRRDGRLRNKDEILAIRLAGKTPLAVAVKRLRKGGEFVVEHEGVSVSIATTRGGASEVRVDGKRVPAHRAFWFGWQAQFPGSRLVR